MPRPVPLQWQHPRPGSGQPRRLRAPPAPTHRPYTGLRGQYHLRLLHAFPALLRWIPDRTFSLHCYSRSNSNRTNHCQALPASGCKETTGSGFLPPPWSACGFIVRIIPPSSCLLCLDRDRALLALSWRLAFRQFRLLLFHRATAPITVPEIRARRRAILAFEEVHVSDVGSGDDRSAMVSSVLSRSTRLRRLHGTVERYELRHHDPCCHQSISFTPTRRLQIALQLSRWTRNSSHAWWHTAYHRSATAGLTSRPRTSSGVI